VAAKAAAPEVPAVKFELYERNARAVFVAGTFNAWNPTAMPLKSNGNGKWETTLRLTPGKYQYRFIVDGKWIADPLAKETVPNPFEGVNSVLVVK
jgi:1,4-alpha-glucan branching enzyme